MDDGHVKLDFLEFPSSSMWCDNAVVKKHECANKVIAREVEVNLVIKERQYQQNHRNYNDY